MSPDAKVARCAGCGSWSYAGVCTTCRPTSSRYLAQNRSHTTKTASRRPRRVPNRVRLLEEERGDCPKAPATLEEPQCQ